MCCLILHWQNLQITFCFADELDPFDTMWPVQEVHKQAEKSLAGLVQYR